MSKRRNQDTCSLVGRRTLYDMNDARRPDGYPNADPDGYIDRSRMAFYKEWFAYIDDECDDALYFTYVKTIYFPDEVM